MPREKRLIQKEDIMPLDVYTIQRKELRKKIVDIIPNIKSTDKQNRERKKC